jgi:hypothetical protein
MCAYASFADEEVVIAFDVEVEDGLGVADALEGEDAEGVLGADQGAGLLVLGRGDDLEVLAGGEVSDLHPGDGLR